MYPLFPKPVTFLQNMKMKIPRKRLFKVAHSVNGTYPKPKGICEKNIAKVRRNLLLKVDQNKPFYLNFVNFVHNRLKFFRDF